MRWHQRTTVTCIGMKLYCETLLLKMARLLNQKSIFTDIHPYRPLNDQNFAEKPVAHNLLDAFCRLIDSLYFFLASKRSFSIIVKTSPFSSSFCCEIFTDF